jgi:Domain of Unknown Function (DUF1080)
VEQTNVGDLVALHGFQLDSWIDPKTSEETMPTFLEPAHGGVARVLGGKGISYQKHLAGEFEVEGWNTAEVIAKGDSVTHILNGHVVNCTHAHPPRADDRDGARLPPRGGVHAAGG